MCTDVLGGLELRADDAIDKAFQTDQSLREVASVLSCRICGERIDPPRLAACSWATRCTSCISCISSLQALRCCA